MGILFVDGIQNTGVWQPFEWGLFGGIKVRVERTGEEMLAMGADLRDAKQVCREDGKLFEDWCGSDECPVSYKTAQKLMSVTNELGSKKESQLLFEQGFNVLKAITQTRDEDIRQALLAY